MYKARIRKQTVTVPSGYVSGFSTLPTNQQETPGYIRGPASDFEAAKHPHKRRQIMWDNAKRTWSLKEKKKTNMKRNFFFATRYIWPRLLCRFEYDVHRPQSYIIRSKTFFGAGPTEAFHTSRQNVLKIKLKALSSEPYILAISKRLPLFA